MTNLETRLAGCLRPLGALVEQANDLMRELVGSTLKRFEVVDPACQKGVKDKFLHKLLHIVASMHWQRKRPFACTRQRPTETRLSGRSLTSFLSSRDC
ncbi:unnamed protein product, partial [Effrenium voratum]